MKNRSKKPQDEGAGPPASELRVPRSAFEKQKILIVDDKEANLVALEKVLRTVDAEVIKACSGNEALKAALNHDFALVIQDVQMPGMDGYEIAGHLRGDDKTKAIPIVFVTASYADEQHMFEGYEAGGVDYIVKPYIPEILVGKVKVFLEMDHYKRALRMHRDHLETLVTERSAELKKRERYFRSLMYSMHEDIVVIDRDYVITDVNNSFVRTVGRMRDEVIGKRCYEVSHGYAEPCTAHGEQCVLREVFETGEPRSVQHVHTRADGSKVHAAILLSPMKDEAGNVTRVVEAMRDVTDLMQAIDALRDAEARYRAIFEGASEGIMVAHVETKRFTYANPAICRMLGYTRKEFMRLSVADIHPKESLEHVVAEFEAQARGEKDVASGIPCLRKDGSVFYSDITTTPAVIGGRKCNVGFFIDVSERRQMEEQSRQAQKLESIGTLAGGVAHEINNPINGIMNYAQLILDKLGPDSPVAEFATEIGKETERVSTIVKNLLSFARQEKQTHSPARMCDIVESTLSLIRAVMRHDQITLEVDVPEDLPKVKCRSQQIQQVIMNLLTNARDALNDKYEGFDENKKVIITANEVSSVGCRVSSEDPETDATRDTRHATRSPCLRLTVEDSGSGIPEDVRARMFDPFYTTKPRDKGTGLGLSISHGIVKDHRGELSVESEVGEFTRFHLDLPVDNEWELAP